MPTMEQRRDAFREKLGYEGFNDVQKASADRLWESVKDSRPPVLDLIRRSMRGGYEVWGCRQDGKRTILKRWTEGETRFWRAYGGKVLLCPVGYLEQMRDDALAAMEAKGCAYFDRRRDCLQRPGVYCDRGIMRGCEKRLNVEEARTA